MVLKLCFKHAYRERVLPNGMFVVFGNFIGEIGSIHGVDEILYLSDPEHVACFVFKIHKTVTINFKHCFFDSKSCDDWFDCLDPANSPAYIKLFLNLPQFGARFGFHPALFIICRRMFVKYVGKLNCPPSRMTQGNLGCMRTDEGQVPLLEDQAPQAEADGYHTAKQHDHPGEAVVPVLGRVGAEARQQKEYAECYSEHECVTAKQRIG